MRFGLSVHLAQSWLTSPTETSSAALRPGERGQVVYESTPLPPTHLGPRCLPSTTSSWWPRACAVGLGALDQLDGKAICQNPKEPHKLPSVWGQIVVSSFLSG